MGLFSNFITVWLAKNEVILNIVAFVAAFGCYFSMYAFRKPFTAAKFEDLKAGKLDYKILLVTLQLIGYMLSKFAGIKIISESGRKWRGIQTVLCILCAEICLIFFAFVPVPYNGIFMFLNGLSLGIIWGLVFSFLEGRRFSEILGTGMSISFIVSSGVVKAAGKSFIDDGMSEFWMPAVTGACFFPVLLLTTYWLELVPDPSPTDEAERTERVPMNNHDRIAFVKEFAPGLGIMVAFYMILTALRDFRDNFAPELWKAFGYGEEPARFALSELIVGFCVLVPTCCLMAIKNLFWRYIGFQIMITAGMALAFLFTILKDADVINGEYFMVIAGICLYLAYVPFNCVIYDLMIAVFQCRANSGFLIYISDSLGYLASTVVLFIKNFAAQGVTWDRVFLTIAYIVSAVGSVFMGFSLFYTGWKYRRFSVRVEGKPEDTEEGTCEEKVPVT
jgi:hypothetical protein